MPKKIDCDLYGSFSYNDDEKANFELGDDEMMAYLKKSNRALSIQSRVVSKKVCEVEEEIGETEVACKKKTATS